jgi:hypothetical protein
LGRQRTLNEYQLAEYSRHLNKISKINENVSEQLFGSVIYLLKYSEKYGIKLPKKEQLENILFNAKPLLESYNQAIAELKQTDGFFHREDPDGDFPVPMKDGFKYHIRFLMDR